MDPQNGDPEIKVTDRRRFTPEGEPLDVAEEAPAPAPEQAAEVPRSELLPASFATLVISLRFEAEMQLGIYPGQRDSGHPPDLESARHTIDLLGVLEEKTRGNLALEEKRLLENSLTELRFRYIQALETYTKKK